MIISTVLDLTLLVPVQPAHRQVSDETRERAIRTIQAHLDKEARNRRIDTIAPMALCSIQKAELVEDLSVILDVET